MNLKMSLTTLLVAAGLVLPASAQSARQFSVEASNSEDLAATGEWTEVAEDLWQRDLDGVQAEMAFGETALALALDTIEADIHRLAKPQSRQQELDLLELELQRDELLAAAEQMQAPFKATIQQTACSGHATITHWYAWTGMWIHTVRSTSTYTEPGPISPFTKFAYARAKACSSDGQSCVEPTPMLNASNSWIVSSEVEASMFLTGSREAYGYVLVRSSIGNPVCMTFLSTSVLN